MPFRWTARLLLELSLSRRRIQHQKMPRLEHRCFEISALVCAAGLAEGQRTVDKYAGNECEQHIFTPEVQPDGESQCDS